MSLLGYIINSKFKTVKKIFAFIFCLLSFFEGWAEAKDSLKAFVSLKPDQEQIVKVTGDLQPNLLYLSPLKAYPSQCLKLITPRLDTVRMYRINQGVSELIYSREGLADVQKKYIHYILPLKDLSDTDSFVLEIKSSYKISFKMILEEEENSRNREQIFELWFSLFSGIMIVMIIYNLFLFVSIRDKAYLWYVLYILTVLFTQLSIFGFGSKYLWHHNEWMSYQAVNIFTSLVGIASLEFFKIFNQTKENFPVTTRYLNIHHVIYVCALIYSFLDIKNVPFAYTIISANASILSTLGLILAFILLKRGFRPAKFFIVAWLVFIVGIVLYILKDFGMAPLNFITRYMMPIGSALETVILSLALADRINILKKEKEESQARTLAEMEKNAELIKNQNVVLEKTVAERTAELNKTVIDLKQTQSQLVASEKLASLGQLTAGIAHEINNPINFVSSNIEPLKADINDLIHLLNLYKEKVRQLNLEEFKTVEQFEEEIDLQYTISEIQTLMKGIREGADRTTEIVSSLRTFARTDELAVQTVNINDTIDSTLTILKNNLGRINVNKNYEDLPEIEAYAGRLNQAIMNVLTNAIQAIKSKFDNEAQGNIDISTAIQDQKVRISIADNGPGIPEEFVDKIFEPFFTTKDVGMGTGLGLSITYGIIEQHKGKIYVEEHGNTGTTITIEIPTEQT